MRPPSAGRAIPRTARGWENARHGRGRGLFASCACGNGRPHQNRGISAEMQCGTAPRAARDLPARPVPRKTAGAPGMERPESIPLGSPPRTARRGMEPCSPVSPFFLDRGLWLGEGASHTLGGVPGRISASGRQKCFRAPAIFLWYRQAAPSLSKKEMVGPTVPRLEGGFPRPAARGRTPSSPRRGIPRPPRRARNRFSRQKIAPLRGGTPLSGGFGKPIPQAALPPASLTQGGPCICPLRAGIPAVPVAFFPEMWHNK